MCVYIPPSHSFNSVSLSVLSEGLSWKRLPPTRSLFSFCAPHQIYIHNEQAQCFSHVACESARGGARSHARTHVPRLCPSVRAQLRGHASVMLVCWLVIGRQNRTVSPLDECLGNINEELIYQAIYQRTVVIKLVGIIFILV